jgi:ketosteroid isomerase-like protein
MKKYWSVIPLVFLLCSVIGCQKATERPTVDVGEAREAVSQAISAWNNANDSSDLEAMLALVAEDAMFTSGAGFMNKTEIGEYWSSQISQGNHWKSYPPEKLEISASGDLAYALCRYEFTRVTEGESRTTAGTFNPVWKKQADGSWKMVCW